MEFKKTTTEKGWPVILFEDRYKRNCSIQKSSLAFEDAIWFGINDPEPKIMTSAGWAAYPIPEDVLISTRMHLTVEQIRELLPILQKFAETGEI